MRPPIVFISLLLICGLASADDNTPVFHSNVAMGRIDALVLDRAQRPIGGLNTDDFLLRRDGRPIPIHNLSYEDLPVDVLLLLDVSGSMRSDIQSVSSAAHQALAVLGDQDRVGIMVFDTRTRLQLPFRQDRDQVERKLDVVVDTEPFNGGTNINGALLNAAAYVEREGRPKMRHAIVIVTDDQALPCDQARVLAALDRADAVLMVLLAPTFAPRSAPYPSPRGRPSRNPSLWSGGSGPYGGIIRRRPTRHGTSLPGLPPFGNRYPDVIWAGSPEIARSSGGDALPVNHARAVEATFERIRRRYALYFYLPDSVTAERGMDLNLSNAARQKHPDAAIQYRQVALGREAGSNSNGSLVDFPRQLRNQPTAQDQNQTPSAVRHWGISDPSSTPPVIVELQQ